jgi:hypothetical protein
LQPNVLLIYRENSGHESTYEDAKEVLDFVLEKASIPTPKEDPAKK